jgi:hypothetical protein
MPADGFSAKIMDLTSKENAYEDTLTVLKKAFKKD